MRGGEPENTEAGTTSWPWRLSTFIHPHQQLGTKNAEDGDDGGGGDIGGLVSASRSKTLKPLTIHRPPCLPPPPPRPLPATLPAVVDRLVLLLHALLLDRPVAPLIMQLLLKLRLGCSQPGQALVELHRAGGGEGGGGGAWVLLPYLTSHCLHCPRCPPHLVHCLL